MLESFSLNRYFSDKLLQLFGTLPIIGEIIQQDQSGLKMLCEYCKFFKYLPQEEVISCGNYNPWIFYVLSGKCLVVDEEDRNVVIETIEAGQMFGELDVVMDTTGQKTILADPASQEIILLGFNSSIFTVQSGIRLVDDSTRIGCYQALLKSMLKRHNLLLRILRNQGGAEDFKEYESLAFNGQSDSKSQLIFFDIETKKLAMELNSLHSRVIETARNRSPDLPEDKTYLTDEDFNKQAVYDFTYVLPYRLQSAKDEPSAKKEEKVKTGSEEFKTKPFYHIQELSFLVVDDDDHHRESAVTILKELGAEQIQIEKNGQAAWDFICKHPNKIDIILCDWIMPEMNGLDLYHRILESGDQLGKIIFIMLTSIESKTSVLEAVENGVHGYVIKPVNQKYILKQVQQALKHVRGAMLKT